MKNLPKIRWVEDPNSKKLKLWFALRKADLVLRSNGRIDADSEILDNENAAPNARKGSFAADGLIADYDFDVGLGQVRLLSPALTPGCNRPVYVGIFRQWDNEHFLIAPFSPYSLAATRTELEFPDRSHALRVICPWNTHTVHWVSILESWKVDDLSADEIAETFQVFRHASMGHPLPEALLPRIGCPIHRLSDPRIEYQDEEVSNFSLLNSLIYAEEADTPHNQEGSVLIEEVEFRLPQNEELPLAARTTGILGTNASVTEKYRIPGFALEVSFSTQLRGKVVLSVFDSNGEQSQMLNHSAVIDLDNKCLAVIRNGMARWLTNDPQARVRIVLPSGQTLKMRKI